MNLPKFKAGTFETSALPLWRYGVAGEIKRLRSFVEEIEIFFSEQNRKFAEAFQASTAGMTKEQWFEEVEWASEHFDLVEHDLPRILRYSMFVHAYSIFEFKLQGIADLTYEEWNLSPAPDDLKGKGIRRAKDYLEQIAGVAVPCKGLVWQDIRVLADIRNIVVHRAGFLPGTDGPKKRIKAFMRKWSNDFRLDEACRVCLSPEFVIRVLDLFQSFLTELFDILEKNCITRTGIPTTRV